jgi:hypothetical protein
VGFFDDLLLSPLRTQAAQLPEPEDEDIKKYTLTISNKEFSDEEETDSEKGWTQTPIRYKRMGVCFVSLHFSSVFVDIIKWQYFNAEG